MFDIGSLHADHQRFLRANRMMIADTMYKAANEAERHVRDKPGFTHRTGRLLASTKGKGLVSRGSGRMVVSASAKYAPYLEHGTKPHIIRPKKKRSLRFLGMSGLVFSRLVRHPGTRPYKFLSRARDHAYHWARSTLQNHMRKISRSF